MANLHGLIETGDLNRLKTALADGVDIDQPGHCGATPLMAAIKKMDESAFDLLVDHGADPDRTDDFNHTALQVAVQHDWPYAVVRLIAMGVDLGRHPKYPLKKVGHLLNETVPQLGAVPLPKELVGIISEEEWQETTRKSLADMAERDPKPEPVIADACSLAVLQLLIDAGEPLEDAPPGLRRAYIGLPAEAPLECSRAAYMADRSPRYGTANPERVESAYLQAMIRGGGNAYVARQKFDDEDFESPVWCYDRFGHSLTKLPDGRFVGIAGEHEDSYDPDFCIYNDVFIHDGHGGVTIFRYPENVFPPTDFHTATLVGNQIIIIGNLGYGENRQPGTTPVFSLDLTTMSMHRVATTGDHPGWISRHRSHLNDHERHGIVVSGGETWVTKAGDGQLMPNPSTFFLDLSTFHWSEILADSP